MLRNEPVQPYGQNEQFLLLPVLLRFTGCSCVTGLVTTLEKRHRAAIAMQISSSNFLYLDCFPDFFLDFSFTTFLPIFSRLFLGFPDIFPTIWQAFIFTAGHIPRLIPAYLRSAETLRTVGRGL